LWCRALDFELDVPGKRRIHRARGWSAEKKKVHQPSWESWASLAFHLPVVVKTAMWPWDCACWLSVIYISF
jgi:hypothetical protein